MGLIWILQLPINNACLFPGQVEGPCWIDVPFSLLKLMSRGTCCSVLLLTMITWFKFYLIDFSIIKLLIFPLGFKNTTPPPNPQYQLFVYKTKIWKLKKKSQSGSHFETLKISFLLKLSAYWFLASMHGFHQKSGYFEPSKNTIPGWITWW